MSTHDLLRQHEDWPANFAAGRQAFLDGLREKHAVPQRYRSTVSSNGHLAVRMTAWREGYAAAAREAGKPVNGAVDLVG